MLAWAARGIGYARVLIALTAREEELVDTPSLETLIRDLAHERVLDRLPLGRLSRSDVDQLVRGVVPAATSPAEVERVQASSWRISRAIRSWPSTRLATRPSPRRARTQAQRCPTASVRSCASA